MRFHLECNQLKNTEVLISGSKSISNRLLILKSLYENISILNISSSDDTKFLEKALQLIDKNEINIGHAGTAMRFLTALLSYNTTKNIKLFGSKRMHKRPIGILVNSLNELGASIEFIENYNFPPLLIKPATMVGKKIRVKSGISSQFISSLLLIGPKLKGGIEIELDDTETSFPYIEMTINLLKKIGVDVNHKDRIIKVN
ncbi:3-phosphoshikimate 1-carboxyvinyltransferase, partial [bacterium]|nr:3-phosphoshikimate 1-carboxyvinyltransferase [bacterium]